MIEHVPLRSNEFNAAKTRAHKKWVEKELGPEPRWKTVRKQVPNTFSINFLEWAAVAVLAVLTIFTSFKVGGVAVPFSQMLLGELTRHTPITTEVQTAFTAVTILLFALLATPALVYFQLLANDPEILEQKKNTVSSWRLSLEYLTPRIPAAAVYLSTAWLFLVSSAGEGYWLEKFIPVIVEVGLAHLVGTLLKKNAAFNDLVRATLEEKLKPYQHRRENYEVDPAFLRTLYGELRDEVLALSRRDPRTGRQYKPNSALEGMDPKEVEAVLMNEYLRFSGGTSFATRARDARKALDGEIALAVRSETGEDRRRVPPNGIGEWTPELLARDLKARGIDLKSYGEKDLQNDYEADYGARSAWRSGAKELVK